MSPFTIFDVVNMVISEKLIPEFFDINKNDFSLSLKELKKKINDQTLALILTHYHIEPLEYRKIVKYCEQKNIFLIEDRAIAFKKAKIKERLNKRHFIFFSFSPFKFVSTINLGAVATNNQFFHSKIKNYEKKFKYTNFLFMISRVFFMLKFYIASRNFIFLLLFNFIKISELLNITNFKNLLKNDPDPKKVKTNKKKNYFLKITNYQKFSAYNQINIDIELFHNERQKRAKIYSKYLLNEKNISFKPYKKKYNDCYLSFPILCKNRDRLYQYLIKNNLDVSKYFYRDCNRLEIFKKFESYCPNTNFVVDHILMLPVYPSYPIKNVKKICKTITEFYK